ncbi:MAG TPA: phosphatase PAP2 family protein [Gemmatimonadaceae bacterium]|nr:phosphatase PAP2 family protein [Gemmatimonadaceae bacterium]
MIRAAPLRLIGPLVFLAACSERPTSPAAADLSATAVASADQKDTQELATIVWQQTARSLAKTRALSPIVAPRAYALVGLAQYAAADAVKKDERRGAVAGASVQVLSYIFKLDIAAIEAQLAAEGAVGTADEQAAFARGVTAGRAMGEIIVARGKADGFANADGTAKVWDPATLPAGPTIWAMDADATPHVPAGFQYPYMRPYFLTSADQFRSPPPLTDLTGQVNEVIEIVKNRTPEQAAMAVALNLGPGSITPAGDFGEKAEPFIRKRNMDERAAAHVYALLNAAIMDAVIGCWDTKYTYLVLRPWMVAPADLPFSSLIIGRPNHPSYPSGHSCVSASAATVLERFFPENTTELEQRVIDNGMSRIIAGIHYRMDVEAGQALGRNVAHWAIQFDNTNGLLAAVLQGYRGNDDR